ncbi:hypothetical protein [Streptomyces agglomeratus]|uniref:hypothetical protein n=1 Tax=Streptomyces agglomeratus TaxID=285458 RepID=UPI00114CE4AE|nr:hypothetical protein [Streptomyces agglomeratus]
MATVTHYHANDVYQAEGTAAWNLPWGENYDFWSFSAMPVTGGTSLTLERTQTNRAGVTQFSTDIVTRMISSSGGGMVKMSATRVAP